MAHINRKYIDSHWLIFAVSGLISIIFGWIFLFNSGKNFTSSLSLIGIYLLFLSVVEFFNALNRAHKKEGWLISVLVAMFDSVAALFLLFTMDGSLAAQLITVAAFTIIRGVAEIIIGFRTTVDPTDRFIWIISGICGAVMGLVILNSAQLDQTIFVRFFGSYVLIFGLSSLIYGIHNRSQKVEDRIARSEAAKNKKSKKSKISKKSKKASR